MFDARIAVRRRVERGDANGHRHRRVRFIRLLFADRGVHIPDDALKYIGDRVERSYWVAERVVEAVDRFAIAERSRLTLPTIRRALAEGGIIDARGAA